MQDDVRLAAGTCVPVLITSESAPERERCARLIHRQSAVGDGPFVAFRGDVAAEPERTEGRADVIGAPRDNTSLRQWFDEARGGTLFIDDLATLTADAQLELLSLLDQRQCPEGAVRILAGASRYLDVERTSGRFNDRLFYRLNQIHLDLKDEGGSTAGRTRLN